MRRVCVSIVAVVGLAASSNAQTAIPWVAGSGNWSSAANWSGGMVPNDFGERGVISAPGTYTVFVDASFGINSLLIPNPMAGVHLNNGITLSFGGTTPLIDHAGPIVVNSTSGPSATLVQFNASGTIGGSAPLVLNASGDLNTAYLITSGAGTILTNNTGHQIRGTGNIYANLVNEGTVTADVAGRTLQLISSGKTNNSVIEATNGGTLSVSGLTVTQGPGAVIRAGDGSVVNLASATILGGEIQAIGTGQVRVMGGSATLAGVRFGAGQLGIFNNQQVTVTGGLTNEGAITVNTAAGPNATILQFNDSGTLGGAGEVLLNASADLNTAYIQTAGAGTVMTVGADQLIHGVGNVYARLVNEGVIRADVSGRMLQLLSFAKTNNNVIEAVGGATLQINGMTLTQGPTGRVLIDGSTLLLPSATIVGGEIRATNGGTSIVTGGSAVFDHLAALEGTLQVTNNQSLIVHGGLAHDGEIVINPFAGPNAAILQFNDSGTLGGTGEVRLNASADLNTAYIQTAGAGTVMTNAPGHMIHGVGNVYARLINDGVIRADVSGRTLQLVGFPKTNNNLIEAINGGTISISGFTLTQGVNGQVRADASAVTLASATIVGGELHASNGGIIQVAGGASVFTDVAQLTGPLTVANGLNLVVNGGLSHTGEITVNSTAGPSGTFVQFNSTGSLGGAGELALNASTDLNTAYLQTAGAGTLLTNGPGHVISGRGHLYGNFRNDGVISPGSDSGDLTNIIRRQGVYTCGSTSQIIIDLDGTSQGSTYDWFDAAGVLNLDGALQVRLAPGYLPPRNTVFTVVTGSTRVGQFASVTLPSLPPSLGYPRIEYTATGVNVRIPQCPTDWNARDGINSQDFFDFLSDFFAGTSDFNFDGVINSQDFFDFLLSFFGGCEG